MPSRTLAFFDFVRKLKSGALATLCASWREDRCRFRSAIFTSVIPLAHRDHRFTIVGFTPCVITPAFQHRIRRALPVSGRAASHVHGTLCQTRFSRQKYPRDAHCQNRSDSLHATSPDCPWIQGSRDSTCDEARFLRKTYFERLRRGKTPQRPRLQGRQMGPAREGACPPNAPDFTATISSRIVHRFRPIHAASPSNPTPVRS